MPVRHLKETPSQTAGPYVHIGAMPAQAGLPLRQDERLHVIAPDAPGPRIRIEGTVWDGGGFAMKDAMIELWQADGQGVYDAPGFMGWGRACADFQTGLWAFDTIKPGRVKHPKGGLMAPFLTLLVFARGINIHLHTRMYFPEDAEAHGEDAVLRAVEHRDRVKTLIATRAEPAASASDAGSQDRGVPVYRFDIRLQSIDETIFFDF